jgi:flagellin
MDAMIEEIDRIADTTTWAGTNLMSAGPSPFEFQVGTATGDANQIEITIGGMTATELGLGGSGGISASDFSISQHTNAAGTKYDTLVLDEDASVVDANTDTFHISHSVKDATDTVDSDAILTLFGKSVELTGIAQADQAAIEDAFSGFGVSVQITAGYNTTDDASATPDADPATTGQGVDYLTLTVPQPGASSNLSVSSADNALAAVDDIDDAILTVNNQRSELGAVSNRLNHTVNNLTNISSNLSAAKGGIEDADFALETTNLAKNQILQQASTAMLAQANASKQNVLSLLQG